MADHQCVIFKGFGSPNQKLNGTYHKSSSIGPRAVYRKSEAGCVAFIYYYKGADIKMTGWWVGPEVDGDTVWAYNQSMSTIPPKDGWRHPWESKVPNRLISLSYGGTARPAKRIGGAPTPIPSALNPALRRSGSLPVRADADSARVGLRRDVVHGRLMPNRPAPAAQMRPEIGMKRVEPGLRRPIPASKRPEPEVRAAPGLKRPAPVTARQPAAKKQKPKTEEEIAECVTKINTTTNDCQSRITKCTEMIDKLKDVAVMFTCEVVEHMPPDDVLEMKTKAEDIGKEASDELAAVKKEMETLRVLLESIRLHACHLEMRKNLEALAKSTNEYSRDIMKNLADVSRGSQKALQRKKAELQNEAAKSQRVVAQKIKAFQMLAKPMRTSFKDLVLVKEIREKESVVLAMLTAIEAEVPNVSGQTLSLLRATQGSLKGFLKQLQDRRKDINLLEGAKVDELGILLATKFQEYMKKSEVNEEALFSIIAQKDALINEGHISNFISSANLDLGEGYSIELLSSLFGRALVAASTGSLPKEALTKDDFFLYVAHAFYSVRTACVLELDDKKKANLEEGDMVELTEGPIGDPLKVRCKLLDGSCGWTQFKNLQRMSPMFTVKQETVLTDMHELKGFSVVLRLKPGMRLLASKIPAIDSATKLLRVPVTVIPAEDDEDAAKLKNMSGFVTIKGNKGAQLLKQESAAPADFGESEVAAKTITDEHWAKMITEHTGTVLDAVKNGVAEIESLREGCEQKCLSLEALSDGWTEEVLMETSKTAMEAWEKIDQLIQNLTSMLATQTRDLVDVHADVKGLLCEVKASYDQSTQKLTEIKLAHAESTKRARVVNKKLVAELTEHQKKRESAEVTALVDQIINDSIGKKELAIGMHSRLAVDPEVDEASVLGFQELLTESEEMIASMIKWGDETRKDVLAKKALLASKKNDFTKSMNELSAYVTKLSNLHQAQSTKLKELSAELIDKSAVVLAKALRDHMEMSQLDEEKFFAQLANGGSLKLPSLEKFLVETLKVEPKELSSAMIGKIFRRVVPKGAEEINAYQFGFLTTCHYKVVKMTTITDSLSIKGGEKVCVLKVDDTVCVLSPMELDESTSVYRVKVSYVEGDEKKEGYVTVKGNQGTKFLEAQSFYYRVAKDTVITNKFDMQDFAVIRRLKVGDILRALSLPREEKQSGLWRLEVIALMEREQASISPAVEHSGFVTMKGNQGTSFLEAVSIDGMDLEEPSETVMVTAEPSETTA